MKEFFGNLALKIKKPLKKLFKITALIFLFLFVCQDVDRYDGGYIRPIFAFVISIAMSCFNHAMEIANTPLASLTIAKIFILSCYCFLARYFAMSIYGIWTFMSDLLDSHEENQVDMERQKKEEELLYAESQDECDELVSRMQDATNLHQLDAIFYMAIGKRPECEKKLSRVYRERKNCLEISIST